MFDFLKNEEKKVEYIELIYDLFFVYIIGRNNSLVSHISNGFIEPHIFLSYVLCTLITIQIWYMTILFINRYGDNSFREYIGLFINMFLLYYIADGTRVYWQESFYTYNIAWALILLNISVQYYLKYRETKAEAPWESLNIKFFIQTQLLMILVIAAGLVVYSFTGIPLTPLAMVVGFAAAILGRKKLDLISVDFPHLTERVMLYVVFTFGEMIIAISGYFTSELSWRAFYYSLCAFLIVVGLFMSYGFFYDKLLDRDMTVSGNTYMLIHIFIIFALSSLTMALEFMREDAIALIPKTAYLIGSFTVYYVFLFMLAPFIKGYCGSLKDFRVFGVLLIVFIALMILSYNKPLISIGVSVLMTFACWNLEYRYWKNCVLPQSANSEE
ncbi:MAG: low temperature requirement protein A [Mogibacterium sp.]|nr:low temperature requirement protein A [Mogibacterium sp.]